jgi:hypothetical protein
MSSLGEGQLFGLIAVACLGGFIILAAIAIRSAKKWMAQFLRQAARLGWRQVDDPAGAPAVVVEAARSHRSVLLLYHHERGAWMSWHRWTETSGSSDNRSTTTRNLTRYFVALRGWFPDMSVVRRTQMGAFFKARRGLGTGDEDFDRAFVIKPTDSPQAVRVVTPRLAQALKVGEVPEFSITANVVDMSFDSAPDWRELQPRSEQLSRLARLLTRS